jgi:hypothetical protein
MRRLTEARLESVTARRDRIETLEQYRNDLLRYMSDAVPGGIE